MAPEEELTARRRRSRAVRVGPLQIGGGAPIVVQSMLKSDPHDEEALWRELRRLARLRCEVVRLAIPDAEAAEVLGRLKKRCAARGVRVPLVADIHFDYRLALRALESGADKLRLNPGNIGGAAKVRAVARAAAERGVPIRVGVNSGSLERDLRQRWRRNEISLGEAMAESALRQAALLEENGLADIVISTKAPDLATTREACRLVAERSPYPLHLGITEAGPGLRGITRSAAGLALLLAEGLGDTVRVSLSGPATAEVETAWELLRALGLRRGGVEIISCPTCGRCQIDVAKAAAEVARRLAGFPGTLRVAVMGCAVNGPGEARQADVGVAGSTGGRAYIFRHGRLLRQIPAERMIDELIEEVRRTQECAGRKR